MTMGKMELISHMRELAKQLPDMELNGLMIDAAVLEEHEPKIDILFEDGSEISLKGTAL